MSNNNLAREALWLQGGAAAFLVGSVAVLIGGASDQLHALLTSPLIVVLGLLVASSLGAALARRVAKSRLEVAIGIAIVYGLVVPVLVAGLIALPLAPIAAMFATVAWPVTVPAALAWLVLIRWDHSRERLAAIRSVSTGVILAMLLLVLRFTQPGMTVSAVAGECRAFPGEQIRAIAWSPDGGWLGFGSDRHGEGIVRVLEQASGKVIELARGPYVDAAWSGLAVGPAGATAYLVNVQGASASPEPGGTALWIASPIEAARRFADLPTPGLSDFTWTPEGIAAVQWVDPVNWSQTHRLVWVRPNTAAANALEPIAPERVLEYGVLAPLVNTSPAGQMDVRTPSGDRRIVWPTDASGDLSVTSDGAFLIFHARALTDDGIDEKYNEVVAQSTENGNRVVLVPGDGWTPKVAAGHVAYLTFPSSPDNGVCVKAVGIE